MYFEFTVFVINNRLSKSFGNNFHSGFAMQLFALVEFFIRCIAYVAGSDVQK